MTTITENIVRKLINITDAGFVSGLGNPVPGEMCVEAAICAAFDEPHDDKPTCVSPALRGLSISLNDQNWSSPAARANGLRRLAIAQLGTRDTLDENEFARRLSTHCIQKLVPIAFRAAAELHKDEQHKSALLSAAALCETNPTLANVRAARKIAAAAAAYAAAAYAAAAYAAAAYAAAAYAAYAAAAYAAAAYAAAAYAAAAAAYAAAAYDAGGGVGGEKIRDKILSDFAEACVEILIDMKAPGCDFLFLAKEAA